MPNAKKLLPGISGRDMLRLQKMCDTHLNTETCTIFARKQLNGYLQMQKKSMECDIHFTEASLK